MNKTLHSILEDYLNYNKSQKRLDVKTLKAYRIDITQFCNFLPNSNINTISISDIESYIEHLNKKFKPKTVKRKTASIKAFFQYLEYKNVIEINPFSKIKIRFKDPLLLPKTIPLYTIETLLATIYKENS